MGQGKYFKGQKQEKENVQGMIARPVFIHQFLTVVNCAVAVHYYLGT